MVLCLVGFSLLNVTQLVLVCLELELVTLDSDLKAVGCEFLLALGCELPQLRSHLLASGI